MEPDSGATRAWVLHPDIQSEKSARNPASRLDEAVALATALPGLEVVFNLVHKFLD